MNRAVAYLVDFVVLLILYQLFFRRRWSERGRRILLVNTAMYTYLAFVLFFTLMPVLGALPHLTDHSYVPMRMAAFSDYINGWGDATRQIVLNVVMTIPFGFLFPLRREGGRFLLLKTIFWTFIISLTIELLQPLLHASRASDITDLITNTAGGLVGYLVYLLCRPLTERVLAVLCAERGGEIKPPDIA